MSSNPQALVSNLWNHCSILRDDGLSYGDYLAQDIMEDLQAALEQFATIAEDLKV